MRALRKTPEPLRAERTSREKEKRRRAREDKDKVSPAKRVSAESSAFCRAKKNARGASSRNSRAAGSDGSDTSGSRLVHDAEEASPFRIAYGQTVARGAFAEEIEVAKRTAAAARAARGYDADFAAPLVSRRVATPARLASRSVSSRQSSRVFPCSRPSRLRARPRSREAQPRPRGRRGARGNTASRGARVSARAKTRGACFSRRPTRGW